MIEDLSILLNSSLFKDFTEDELKLLLEDNSSYLKTFDSGMCIISEEDIPDNILILISGKVVIAKDSLAGNRIVLASINQSGELFGEVYAFMDLPNYEIHAETEIESEVLFISKEILNSDNQYTHKLISNLMHIFASKAYTLNKKVRILGASSIREKIARFLLDRQNQNDNAIMTREKMSEYLNVARPSLSRELAKMAKENIIRLDGKKIIITNQKKIEEYI